MVLSSQLILKILECSVVSCIPQRSYEQTSDVSFLLFSPVPPAKITVVEPQLAFHTGFRDPSRSLCVLVGFFLWRAELIELMYGVY